MDSLSELASDVHNFVRPEFIASARMPSDHNLAENLCNHKDEELSSLMDQVANVYCQFQTKDKPLEKEYVRKEKAKDDTSSYRDFSKVAIDKKKEQKSKSSFLLKPLKNMNFPQKLYMILSNPKFEGVITWLPHGRAWKILKPNLFKQFVLPIYFNGGKHTTFVRQVNGWGFRKITHNSYYHEMFLRGIPQLCDQMKRLTKTDMEQRKKEGNKAQPNFHQFCDKHPIVAVVNNDEEGLNQVCKFSPSSSLCQLDGNKAQPNFHEFCNKHPIVTGLNNDEEGLNRYRNFNSSSSLCQLHGQSDNAIIQDEKSEIEKREEVIEARQRRLEAVKRKRLLLANNHCLSSICN